MGTIPNARAVGERAVPKAKVRAMVPAPRSRGALPAQTWMGTGSSEDLCCSTVAPHSALPQLIRPRRANSETASPRLPLSFLLPLAKMAPQTCDKFLWGDLKGVAYTKHREQSTWASRLEHLPVTDAEAVGNHVLLAEFALHSVRPHTVTQGTEEPRKVGRELSAGTHNSKLGPGRTKAPRTNLRIGPCAVGPFSVYNVSFLTSAKGGCRMAAPAHRFAHRSESSVCVRLQVWHSTIAKRFVTHSRTLDSVRRESRNRSGKKDYGMQLPRFGRMLLARMILRCADGRTHSCVPSVEECGIPASGGRRNPFRLN